MDRNTLSGRDICTKYTAPPIVDAGRVALIQIGEEVCITKRYVIVGGNLCQPSEKKSKPRQPDRHAEKSNQSQQTSSNKA